MVFALQMVGTMKTISNELLSNVTGGFSPIAVIAGGPGGYAAMRAHTPLAPAKVPHNTAGWIIQHTKVPSGFKIE